MKRSIELFKEHWQRVLIFSLVILLIAIAMSFNRDSYVLQAWLGADKKEVIGCLYWVIGGVIALYGLFKFEKNWERNIRLLKEYGPWGLIAILIILIFSVMFCEWLSCRFQGWLGTDKKGVIEYLGWAIGGVIALYGLFKLEQRAQAQSKGNELIAKGHEQDRFKAATEHLGGELPRLRIVAFYEFYYLVRDNDSYRENTFDMLFSYWRQIAEKNKSNEKVSNEERMNLLDVLFKKDKRIYAEKLHVSLRKVYFSGMYMEYINLQNADLREANLRKSILKNAKLQGADMEGADLREAILEETKLQGAILTNAKLQGAQMSQLNFREAQIEGANFQKTFLDEVNFQNMFLPGIDFREAFLINTNFQDADLVKAKFENATLFDVKFNNADLRGADLSNVSVEHSNFQGADLRGADMSGMRNYHKADFKGAIYNGETIAPDYMELPNLHMIQVP